MLYLLPHSIITNVSARSQGHNVTRKVTGKVVTIRNTSVPNANNRLSTFVMMSGSILVVDVVDIIIVLLDYVRARHRYSITPEHSTDDAG